MTATCIEGISTNPEILAIADRIFYTVRLSIQRGANAFNNIPSNVIPQEGIERATLDFLTAYKKHNKVAVSKLSGLSRVAGGRIDTHIHSPLMTTPIKLDFAAPKTVLEQAKAENLFEGLKLSKETLANVKWNKTAKKFEVFADKKNYADGILKALAFKSVLRGVGTGISVKSPANAKELRLKLTRLKAVRRFGWEITDWGEDSISCGGDGLDSVQQHIKAPSLFINKFKRDNEDFDIKPDYTLMKFDLNRIGPWPRTFIASVFIAEKDASGGFIDFLQKLWDAIGDEVISLSSSLAIAAVGAGVGSLVGTEIMPIIGSIIGAVVGAVIALLVSWMVDSLKDDIFESPENPLGVVLSTQDSLFPGDLKTSPIYMQDFTLGSARYIMSYYWELVF